jgi:hypothetical protein
VLDVAASMAAAALTMPAPQPEQFVGKGLAELVNLLATSSGDKLGFFDSINATTPATCGAAIEVP